jgi:hypothetical protein
MVGDRARTDEGDVCNARVGSEVFCDIGPAHDRLDDIWIVSTCDEGGGSY